MDGYGWQTAWPRSNPAELPAFTAPQPWLPTTHEYAGFWRRFLAGIVDGIGHGIALHHPGSAWTRIWSSNRRAAAPGIARPKGKLRWRHGCLVALVGLVVAIGDDVGELDNAKVVGCGIGKRRIIGARTGQGRGLAGQLAEHFTRDHRSGFTRGGQR